MPHTTSFALVLAGLLCGALATSASGQQAAPPVAPPTVEPVAPAASTEPLAPRLTAQADYEIGPQDVLAVTVLDQPSLSGKYAVELDGTFTFPFIGRVTAGGLTIRAFESALRDSLADGFFRNPQVAVAVEAYRSQRVFVVGEVRSPGALPLAGGLTLMEAIARAGSTTENASDDIVIVRGGRGAGPATTHSTGVEAAGKQVVQMNLHRLQQGSAGLALQDGDTVFVSRVVPIYVYGQVRTPGSYPIRTETTVLQALSLAGGGTPTAAVNRVSVIRVVNGVKKEYRVNLSDLVYPGDTVLVPERFF